MSYIPILYELETLIRVVLRKPRPKDINIRGVEYSFDKEAEIVDPYSLIDFTDAANRFNTGGALSRKIELRLGSEGQQTFFQTDIMMRYIAYKRTLNYDLTKGRSRPVVDDEAKELGIIDVEVQEGS